MSGRCARAITRLVVLVGLLSSPATTAFAQGTTSAPTRPRTEIAFSGVLVGAASMGKAAATYIRSDGTPFTLFATTNSTRPGFGAEITAGRHVSRAVALEAAAGWSRATLRSRISGDLEDSAPPAIDETLTRVSVEGAVLWIVSQRGAWWFFARGGAGIMRELAGDGIYAATGQIVNAGAGVKYLRHGATGGRTVGVRLEGRANVRLQGIELGTSTTVVAPVISGGVFFGF